MRQLYIIGGRRFERGRTPCQALDRCRSRVAPPAQDGRRCQKSLRRGLSGLLRKHGDERLPGAESRRARSRGVCDLTPSWNTSLNFRSRPLSQTRLTHRARSPTGLPTRRAGMRSPPASSGVQPVLRRPLTFRAGYPAFRCARAGIRCRPGARGENEARRCGATSKPWTSRPPGLCLRAPGSTRGFG